MNKDINMALLFDVYGYELAYRCPWNDRKWSKDESIVRIGFAADECEEEACHESDRCHDRNALALPR